LKYDDPITTDIPAVVVPEIGMCCDAQVVNIESPASFYVQLVQSQQQLHKLVCDNVAGYVVWIGKEVTVYLVC